jgi:DegV family protein with EDD domain
MAKVAVITDSGAAFPQEWYKQNGIYVAQLTICIPQNGLADKKDFPDFSVPHEKFIEIMRAAESRAKEVKYKPLAMEQTIKEKRKFFPSTTGANSAEFSMLCDEAFSEGAEDVMILTILKEVSSTYSAAMLAREQHRQKNHIVVKDTHTVGPAQGFIAKRVDQYSKGHSFQDTSAAADRLINYSKLLVVPNSLDALFAGGRVSTPNLLVGTLLHVVPMLNVKEDKGTYSIHKKGNVRGFEHKAVDSIVSQTQSDIQDYRAQNITIDSVDFMTLHTDNEGLCSKLYKELEEVFKKEGIKVGNTSTGYLPNVLTAHLGLGGIAASMLYMTK